MTEIDINDPAKRATYVMRLRVIRDAYAKAAAKTRKAGYLDHYTQGVVACKAGIIALGGDPEGTI